MWHVTPGHLHRLQPRPLPQWFLQVLGWRLGLLGLRLIWQWSHSITGRVFTLWRPLFLHLRHKDLTKSWLWEQRRLTRLSPPKPGIWADPLGCRSAACFPGRCYALSHVATKHQEVRPQRLG